MSVLKLFLEKVQTVGTRAIGYIFSNAFFILGIGLTALVARVVGKHFLFRQFKNSSWLQIERNENLKKQY